MKKTLFIALIIPVLINGCAQSITKHRLGNYDHIPKTELDTYLYRFPAGGIFRKAFLRSPDTDVEIVPYSADIIQTRGTFDHAMEFVLTGRGHLITYVDEVKYNGVLIGYLIQRSKGLFDRVEIDLRFYEKDGKVYILIWESGLAEDP